jgi:hypothetical protein
MTRSRWLLLALVLSACATVSPAERVISDDLMIGESLGDAAPPTRMHGVLKLSLGGGASTTQMHGVLSLEVTTPDGQVHRRVAPNAWPKSGEAYLVNAWRGLVPLSDARYHALGTSTAAFAENQTQCLAELTNQYLVDNVRATGTLAQGPTPNTFESVGRNTIDRSGVVLGEVCIMTNPTVGQGAMISRILISPPIDTPAGTVVTTIYRVAFE